MLEQSSFNINDNNNSEQNYSCSSFQNEISANNLFQNRKLIDATKINQNQKSFKSYFRTKFYQSKKKDVFNLTYFKQKKHQKSDKKLYENKIIQQNPKIALQKIQQKIKKYVITPISTKSNQNKGQKNRSIELFRQTYHSRSNSLYSSLYIDENKKAQPKHKQHLYLQPLTLKKKLNLIKKQKNILEQQLHTNESILKHQQRNLEKSWRSLSFYKTKLDKISTIRQINNKEREQNQKSRMIFQKMIRNQKLKLKQSIVGSRSNLSISKLFVQQQKKKIASLIRRDSYIMSKQLKLIEQTNIQRKKNTKQCIKTCEKIWLDSVKQWKQDKKLTINQKKLQQITVEIASLQKQKHLNDTFQRQKQSNNPYRNRIKDKKMQIERKLKQYKKNLMIVLNQSEKINLTQNQQEALDFSQIKNSQKIKLRNKRLSVISTQPDHIDHSHQSFKFRNSMMVSHRI